MKLILSSSALRLSLALALISVTSLFSVRAQSQLPDSSLELLKKLEAFEKEQRKSLDEQLKTKRKMVADALMGHINQQKAGSPEALALRSAIDHLSRPTTNPFKVAEIKIDAPTTGVRPKSAVNTEQLYELMLERLFIESRNPRQRAKDPERLSFIVAMDGIDLLKEKEEGCFVVELNQDGIVSKRRFPNNHISDEAKSDETRRALIAYLRESNKENLVLLAITGAFNPVGTAKRPAEIFEIIGGNAKKVVYQQPYICLGYNGLRRGKATESLGDRDAKSATIKPAKK